MSNLEKEPPELVIDGEPPVAGAVEILEPRDVPLGGPRAMTVRRTLPQRHRSLIGAWCFVDHYGPDEVADRGGMSFRRIRTPACRPSAGYSPARSTTATASAATPRCVWAN
jgi:hypothetical protein